jgi:hypothetical protein
VRAEKLNRRTQCLYSSNWLEDEVMIGWEVKGGVRLARKSVGLDSKSSDFIFFIFFAQLVAPEPGFLVHTS